MDRLTSMDVFAKVVAQGSFAGAARQARLSPTAVSKHIQALESWLGTRLLHRSTRRVGLTEAGAAFHAHCTTVLATVAEATGAAGALQTTLSGRLRISAPGEFGTRQVTPVAVDFMARHPQVSVTLDLNDRQVDVVGEGYDLAIMVGRLPDSTLVARRLCRTSFVTCAAPAYLQRRGVPRQPSDLPGHDCLNYAGFLWTAREWNFGGPDGAVQATPIAPRFASATAAVRTACLLGAGILQCPTYAVDAELADGRLVQVLADHPAPELDVHAVHAQGRRPPAKLRGFIDLLAARFGRVPPWEAWRQPAAR